MHRPYPAGLVGQPEKTATEKGRKGKEGTRKGETRRFIELMTLKDE